MCVYKRYAGDKKARVNREGDKNRAYYERKNLRWNVDMNIKIIVSSITFSVYIIFFWTQDQKKKKRKKWKKCWAWQKKKKHVVFSPLFYFVAGMGQSFAVDCLKHGVSARNFFQPAAYHSR